MSSESRRLQPRKQPRQVRSEQTRQRILAAAAHVFAEHGYAAGTTNRIAGRARISIGSLYQYYPNKDAILAELLARHLDAGATAVDRRRADELPDSFKEIIRGFVRIAVDNHVEDPQLLRVMIEEAPRSAELLEKVRQFERERVDFFRDLLERHPDVHVADPLTAARLVVTTVELVVHQLIAAPDPIDRTRFEDELTTMITRYLTAGQDASRGVVG